MLNKKKKSKEWCTGMARSVQHRDAPYPDHKDNFPKGKAVRCSECGKRIRMRYRFREWWPEDIMAPSPEVKCDPLWVAPRHKTKLK